MRYRYFQEIPSDLTSLRNKYKDLMQEVLQKDAYTYVDEITTEYRDVYEKLDESDWPEGETKTKHRKRFDEEDDEKLLAMIGRVSVIPGLSYEVIGSWLWSGTHREAIEQELGLLGWRYSRHRHRWYWAPYPLPDRRYPGQKKK